MGEKESQQGERKPHDGIIRRQVAFDVRGIDAEARAFDMIASTAALDSHGDVVEQNFNLSRYKKNPVVLWNHNAFGFLDGSRPEDFLAIGKSSKIRVEDSALQMRMTLVSGTDAEEPLVNKIWRRVDQGVQRASSIGFRPGLVHEEKTPGGVIYHLDENEIYEVSLVPIGSNPEAVMKSAARDHEWFRSVAKPWTNPTSVQVPSNVGRALDIDPKDFQHPPEILAKINTEGINTETFSNELIRAFAPKGVVPFYAYPPKDTESWDASAAETRVRAWASSDGSGDADKMDWGKYRSAFAWYDDSKSEDFGSFKLLHHDVYNSGLVTSRAGVQAAGNAIQARARARAFPTATCRR
jgi:HK97 family phage prohead protease